MSPDRLNDADAPDPQRDPSSDPSSDPASDPSSADGHPGIDLSDWLDKVGEDRNDEERAALTAAAGLLRSVVDSQQPGALEHGLNTALVLHELQLDVPSVVVGTLTGVLDDLSPGSIEGVFGEEVAALAANVARLDAIAELPAVEGDEQQTERLRKLLLTLVDDVRAALVLLGERLQFMRTLSDVDPADARTTALHTLAVFAPLASRLGIWQLKWELEDLGLRYTEPDAYRRIASQLAERRVDRERYVAAVVDRVRQELIDADILAEVSGRPKHIYSIWRKMQAKGIGFHELFDVRAVRVITSSVTECYAALGVIHGLWRHVPHEFDDYIASPKSNRYQSLHTAVIGPGGRTVEVQIRTRSMNDHADRGVAAHWRYKEAGGGPGAGMEARLAWLRQALQWRAEMDEPDEALARLREEPGEKFIYALTPKGRVIELPAGATAVDFAYRIHTDVGHRCRGARVDGTLVPLTRQLASGETVEILTARQGSPSRDWLNRDLGYLRTPQGRGRVKQWFKRQDDAENVAGGRLAWEGELHRLRLPAVSLEGYPARFNLQSVDELFAAVGRGDIQTSQLVRQVQADVAPNSASELRLSERRGGEGDLRSDVSVEGAGDLAITYAQCCSPLPAEPIVGYVTRGKGVSIHRPSCANVLRLGAADPDRIVDVQWGNPDRGWYSVDLLVSGYDRRGLLRDVTAVIAQAGLDVNAIQSDSGKRDHTVSMRVSLDVHDISELSQLVTRLLQIRNVFEVTREA